MVTSIAEQLGCCIQLRSAPNAAAYAGVGYLHALGEALDHELLIDCHDDAGLVMAALRTGCRKVIFSGREETYQRLSEMAEQKQAWIRREESPSDFCLALFPEDGADRVRDWLLSLSG